MKVKTKSAAPILIVAILSLFAAGCPKNQYVIEMRPSTVTLERELTCWREDGSAPNLTLLDFPEDELAAMQRVYPHHEFTPADKRHHFAAQFSGETPNDVGGNGSYHRYTNRFGSVFTYIERFRGEDDLAAKVERRRKGVDQLTDLALGWLKSEVGTEKRFNSLRDFVDQKVRTDLLNFSLYWWRSGNHPELKPDAETDFIIRIGQYLVERGYCTAEELPVLVNHLNHINRDSDDEYLMSILRRLAATKLSIPDAEAGGRLPFLNSPDALAQSWARFFRTTPQYQSKHKEWETEKQSNAELKEPDPGDVTSELFSSVFEIGASNPHDHLLIKLHLPVAPEPTNGKWDEKEQQVVWEADLEQAPGRFTELPMLCHAAWSQPDEGFQKLHFGQTVLSGESLMHYVLWSRSLTESQSREWDAFIDKLAPGDKLVLDLNGFRFADQKEAKSATAGEMAANRAAYPVELIKAGIEGKKP